MTLLEGEHADRISIRVEAPSEPQTPVPAPGPMSMFVAVLAIMSGLIVAAGFRATDPDTPFIILGATFLVAGTLALVALYRFEWFLLLTIAIRTSLDDLVADEFGTFQPSAILGILVIAICAIHLVALRLQGDWRRITPLGLGFVVFFVSFIPSFVTSVDRGISQGAMFGLASVTLLYLAIEQLLLRDRDAIWRLLGAVAVSLVVPIIVGFVQFFWTGTLDPGGSGLVRIDGSFAHPNSYATFLCFAAILGFSIVPVIDVQRRVGVLALSLIATFLLVATFARGAWGAFLLGAMLLAARINKRFVIVIGAGAVVAAAAVPGVGDRLANLTATTGANGGVKTDDSLAWRLGYWEKVWPFFGDNPVSGVGIDATKTLTVEYKDPHNSFLQALIEGGVIGGFGFFTLVIVATYAAWRAWRSARRSMRTDRRASLLTFGAIAALFSVSVQLITENVLLNTILWWYLNIAFGWVAVVVWGASRPSRIRIAPDEPLALPAAGQTTTISIGDDA